MYSNPYAAPQPGPDPYRTGAPPRGEPQPWDPSDVVGVAWNVFKANWLVMTGAAFVWMVLGSLPQQVPTVLREAGVVDERTAKFVGLPFVLLGLLVGQFFHAGIVRMTLDAGRTNAASFAQLFSAGGNGRFLAYLGTTILMGLAIGVGLLCLVVPGIVLALGLSLAGHYAIDQGLGPVEALKASWQATMGQKGQIFVFNLLSFVVLLAGLAACCVGYVPALFLVQLAGTILYLRVSGTAAGPSAAMGFGGPPPGPPPGFGPPGPPGGFGPPPGFGGPPAGGGFGPPPGFGGPPPAGGGFGPPPGFGGPPPAGGGGYGPPPGF